jgi:hypothetical protein
MRRTLLAVVLLLSVLACARAEDPVYFADARLKAAVEQALYISDPTPTDMLSLTDLICPNSEDRANAISSLAGLEYAVNLRALNLQYHEISNISALSGLANLESVILLANCISNISSLSGLSHLRTLDLEQNEISNISALSGLSDLESVNLHRNRIRDISPLSSLTHLKWVDLRVNPLNRDTYHVYLAQIQANNPGVGLYYDAISDRHLVVSSATGGSVIRPGQGEFTYPLYEEVMLEAKADPCFEFVGWSGTCSSSDNPLLLIVDQDYNLQANFRSALGTIHVDDNAPGDPSPGDAAVSDPQEDGTSAHPFDRVQEAIDVAADGASVFIHAGTYHGTIDLLGKSITLTGFDPDDPNVVTWPVIDGGRIGPVVSLTQGEGSNCVLSGLVITGGWGRYVAAIHCFGSSPTIVNCLIVGNRAIEPDSAPVYCVDSDVTFINCTISDNQAGLSGAALYAVDSSITVVNSILWGNTPAEIQASGTGRPFVRYSTVAGGWPGPGCRGDDPVLVHAGYWAVPDESDASPGPDDPNAVWVMGDYHLQSRAGRYNHMIHKWVLDRVTSPCIDAGDPDLPVGSETPPNGGVINRGAYGGTTQASKSCDEQGNCI